MELHLLSPKMIMLAITNICSASNYRSGNTDSQEFESDKLNVNVVMCDIACLFRNGVVFMFYQFYHSNF